MSSQVIKKGIVLAGGTGSRLQPLTNVISKQLLPVYDKPLVYYPLATLMLAGIKDILIITTVRDLQSFKSLLGDGSKFGVQLSYAIQTKPRGIADAFIIGENFIQDDNCALILGDNIFYGPGFGRKLREIQVNFSGAKIFSCPVADPQRFGVVELDDMGRPLLIEEKPLEPKSNLAVTGLYFFDDNVCDIAKSIEPSERGELEITSINNEYLRRGKLQVEQLGRSHTWLDTGTHESLLEASNFVKSLERNNLFKLGCLEEVAYLNGWISATQVCNSANQYGNSSYGNYLNNLVRRV